jgi:hypothetical protein
MKETRRGRDGCGIGQRLSRAIRRASRYRGMLVIDLWQAPVGPYAGADGSIGLLFGGRVDQYATEIGCSRPTQTASQRYQLAGIEWDRDLDSNFRREGVAGGITWHRGSLSRGSPEEAPPACSAMPTCAGTKGSWASAVVCSCCRT